MWVQAVKIHEQKPETPVNESLLEEAQKCVLHEYWKYLNVFSKTKLEWITGLISNKISNLRKGN